MTKKVFKKEQKGYVLITSIVVIILLMMLGVYYLSFSMTEFRIAKSQSVGVQDYYLAEAGVYEMIWRLKNNDEWRNSFETNPTWQTEFTRSDDLIPGGSYTVNVQNTDLAQASIISTGTMTINGQTSQRVIKTTIYKAIGQSPAEDLAIYTNDNTDINISRVNVYGSGTFANNDLDIWGISTMEIDGPAKAVNQIDTHWLSTLNAEELFSDNYPPAPNPMAQPPIDFDSSQPDSLKNLAIAQGHLYTQSQFSTFLNNNKNATLNGYYYVTGSVEIKRNMNITINGILAADGSISIATSMLPLFSGFSRLTINHTPGQPSGLVSKYDINFGAFTSNINIHGMLYALENIISINLPQQFNITGAVYCRKFETWSIWQSLNITYDEEVIQSTIRPDPQFSPVIYIDHWEEEY